MHFHVAFRLYIHGYLRILLKLIQNAKGQTGEEVNFAEYTVCNAESAEQKRLQVLDKELEKVQDARTRATNGFIAKTRMADLISIGFTAGDSAG